MPRHDTSNTIDSTPISPLNTTSPEAFGFMPPDWIFVTQNGPKVSTSPDSTTIGRYAYAIYDEGGLLDINVAGYHSDGSSYTYSISAGEPLMKRRFPLNRLNWIGPNGPQNGGTAESIQVCFGLIWGDGTTDDGRSIQLWQYVGPTGSTEQGSIETMSQVAAENREPNFFELLQAGILSGSLAVDGGVGGGSTDANANFPSAHQRDPVLQILRIGASIIDQYDGDSYPTVIEYQPASGVKWQAVGVEYLPYLYSFLGVPGKSPDDPIHNLAVYYVFGLWNPHQGTLNGTRPPVRLRVQGSVGVHNYFGNTAVDPVWGQPGVRISINDTIPLATTAGQGVNGFADPGLLTASDAATSPVSTEPGWVIGPLMGGTVSGASSGARYLCYRLPDFSLDITRKSDTTESAALWCHYSSYLDRDGVQRVGDCGLFPPSTTDAGGAAGGNPYQSSAKRTADRPIVLNRPFRSVAELGYVFRDDPWRSLDFFSGTGADAALLDFFTVGEESTDLVAGRVNLNSRNAAVLAAVLNGTLADVIGGTQIGKASNIASSLVAYTASSNGPLLNKSELATKFGPTLNSAGFGNADEQNVKSRREAFVRALADTGQTRTWNLMVDVIGQAGRYPPGANNLADFIVEGERRYWFHIAIDRFTGEVIDRQLELVTE